nr:S-layer family protein [Iningainema tapete]
MGQESSVVRPFAPNSPIDRIDGGAIRGDNLFHSFEQFNVNAGRQAFFTNPPGIKNIISRVTGGSRSEILGTLGVLGSANLFLINSNGIIFGPNALLNIRGSFVATTANAIGFGDRGFFSTSVPDFPPLLTVNPSALLFNQIAKPITNQSTAGLRLPANQSLLLVGGNVNLSGGLLRTQGGRVELGGLAGAGTVGLNVDGNNLRLNFPQTVQRADVSLTNGATVDVSFDRGSGDIQVLGRRITLADGSKIVADNLGSQPGGTLTVSASELVEVTGGSSLSAENDGVGTGGDLTIDTGKLMIRDGALLAAGTFEGLGRNVTVRASDSVELSGTSVDGKPSGISTQSDGSGNAGSVRIETGRLIVQDGAVVSTSTAGSGQGGTLVVTASDFVQLIGTSTSVDDPIPSGLFALARGSGKPGDLTIATRQLIVRDGARASTSNVGSAQSGGTLSVNASESVQLIGTSANSQVRSGLLVGTTGIGSAGELTINTGKLQVSDGAIVSARTEREGRGGSVMVRASDSVEVISISANGQPSLLTTETTGVGDAGNLMIDTEQLTIKDGAQITSSSTELGRAGDTQVQANSLSLDRGSITSQTTSGNGGDITISLKDLLLMRDGSQISSTAGTAQQPGDGGNIKINAPNGFIVAVPSEDSDITANAYTGKGGSVDIEAAGIFGILPRPNTTSLSDITASSTFGVDGTVELNTLEIDPSSGLVNLPTIPIDTEIAQGCDSPNYAQSSFVITGRGGLPTDPRDILTPDAVQVDWVSLKPSRENSFNRTVTSTTTTPKRIVEATGWVVNEKGEVILTADSPTATPRSPWQTLAYCSVQHK